MKNLQKECVPYTIALKLKELGFDELCIGIYFPSDGAWKDIKFKNSQQDNIVASPLFSQAFRWFREKYNLLLDVAMFFDENQLPLTCKNPQKPKGYFVWDYYDEIFSEDKAIKFKTYEEAELACLIKLIEIVEQKTE